MELPDIVKQEVAGKTVLVRCDLDVPLSEDRPSEILDDTRLRASLPTIEYLLKNGAKVIIMGHLGRPEGVEKKYSLEKVAKWFQKNFKFQISNFKFQKIGEFEGWELSENLFALENLRFYPGEMKNDQEFAKKLAVLADIYVNDAFAVVHRSHASIVGVCSLLPHFAGVNLQKEVQELSDLLDQPKRPFTILVGGAKIETKLPLLEHMHHFADYVLVGGKIAQETRELIKVQHEQLGGIKSILLVAELNQDQSDMTSQSIENFLQVIQISQTVVWNGPVGKIDGENNSIEGTKRLAEGIVKSGAYSVVGGGDTLGFLKTLGLLSKFSFISTGGGSMLSFLSGENLPGIEALQNT